MTLSLLLGRPAGVEVADAGTLDVTIDASAVAWTLRYLADAGTLDVSIDGVSQGVFGIRLSLTWSVWAELDPGVWTRIDTPGAHPAGNPIMAMHLTDGMGPEDRTIKAGEGVITLRNANGWLDPSNPASPYFGRLIRGVAIKVRVQSDPGADVHDWWSGHVDRWPLTWDHGTGASDLDVVDELGWIMQVPTPATELHRVIDSLDPSAWWPLDGPTGTAVDVIGGWTPTIVGPVAASDPYKGYGQPIVVGTTTFSYTYDAALAVIFPRVSVPPAVMPPPPWTVMVVLSTATPDWQAVKTNGAVGGVAIGINAAGKVYATIGTVGGLTRTVTDTAPLNVDVGYVVIVTYDATGALTLRVGSYPAITVTGGYLIPAPATTDFTFGVAATGAAKVEATLAHVALWPRVLSAAEAQALADAASYPADGYTSMGRVAYLLALAGWTGASDIGPGNTGVGLDHAHLERRSVGEVLAEAVTAEDGAVWVDGAGTFHATARPLGAPAPSVATLAETAAGGAVPVADMTLLVPAQAVSSARTTGAKMGAYADTSRPLNETELATGDISDPVRAWSRAEREVWRSGQVPVWVDKVVTQPVRTGMAVATAPITTRLDVRRKPPWAPAPITEAAVVVGRELTSGNEANDETITYHLRPALPTRLRALAQGGTTPSWWSTPDTAAVSVRAEFTAMVRVVLDRWASNPAGAYDPLMHKAVKSGTIDYSFLLNWGADLEMWVSTGAVEAHISAGGFSIGDYRPRWLRCTWNPNHAPDQGRGTLAWSWDATDWHTVADRVVPWVGNPLLSDSAAPLRIGGDVMAGATARSMAGYLHEARLFSGGAPGGTAPVVVAEWRPSRDGAADAPSLISSTTGETWSRAPVDPAAPYAGLIAPWS